MKFPKVVVGDEFTETDLTIVSEQRETETRIKAKTTTVLVFAVVGFYGMYIAHEWMVGHSLDSVGQFLEKAFIALLFWVLGKDSSGKSDP